MRQELLAIASMTKIVFEIIRHQLLHGEGLPLGLVSFFAREQTITRLVNVHEHIETWARNAHVATGYVQNILWWDPTWFLKYKAERMSIVKSKAPNVRTACLWQTIETNTSEIQFPRLESYKTYHYNSSVSLAVQPDTWSQDNVSFIIPDLVRTV